MTFIGPGSTSMHLYGAAPATRPSAAPSGPRSTGPASDQGRADMDAQSGAEPLVQPRQNDGGPEIVQVCMHEVMLPAFKAWLAERDLHLFPIPVENGLPTYGIGNGGGR